MLLRLLAFLLFSTVLPLHAQGFDHRQWDALLQKNVRVADDSNSSSADYAQFKKDDAALSAYAAQLAAVKQAEFDGWSKDAQLAFLINAYNAWTVKLIVQNYPGVNSIRDLGSLATSPWQKRFIPLFGAKRSLDDIEHEMIRGSGRYNDPRIHFAVNCASIGCPALANTAFAAATLDAQLETATNAFLSDRSRNYVDAKGAHMSSIFTWYRGDFEAGWRGADTLGKFFALYAGALGLNAEQTAKMKSGELAFDFLDYDWRLNDVKVPDAGVSTGSMSPIWLARSFPVPAMIIGAVLLLLLYGIIRLIRRRRRKMV